MTHEMTQQMTQPRITRDIRFAAWFNDAELISSNLKELSDDMERLSKDAVPFPSLRRFQSELRVYARQIRNLRAGMDKDIENRFTRKYGVKS
tara:strand:+ start:818 stop:1093 length:276 start_codon:yes stop_codon:yes gene_type:complete